MKQELFLGVLVDARLSLELDGLSTETKCLFIKEEESLYLKEFLYEGERYLGKRIESPDFSGIDLLKVNICSLMRKYLLDYDLADASFFVIAV